MENFLCHRRCIIVHTSYDKILVDRAKNLGRYKAEVLSLDLTDERVKTAFRNLYKKANSSRQFQPHLYPDWIRERLDTGTASFKSIGAKVIARVVETKKGALVDIWDPEEPLELDNLLLVSEEKSIPDAPMTSSKKLNQFTSTERKDLANKFFKEVFVDYRNSFLPLCKCTSTTQNLGFANLSQHLVVK